MTEEKYNASWYEQALLKIEECGRVSHKSEGRIKPGSAEPFVRKIALKYGHGSILEHASFTACFIGSRSMSHQLVRHRLAAYTQESQRYCDYSDPDQDPDEGTEQRLKIVPHRGLKGEYPTGTKIDVLPDPAVVLHVMGGRYHDDDVDHLVSCGYAYRAYQQDRERGVKAEDAREVLPNATKTEVYTTFNIRQWRHFFRMRLDSHAQWQIKMLGAAVFCHWAEFAPLFIENLQSHSGEPLTPETVKPLLNPYPQP